ncbi:MAG: zinc ABC transporter substrate-binding protein [Ignavibacteriae bacterium]|nr:zinc ABC transporter substrate-binding protein [Ignavibacteriota bacterium]
MKHLLILVLVLCMGLAQAAVKVVTTLPDLADLTRQVGGDRVTVDNIVRGDQNPHFVEVKPSYMMKLKSADLFFMIGMDLEMWAPQIIDGSRNTKIEVVDLSKHITKLEIPAKLDASEGDVHRYGNPHYWLDPRNVRVMVDDIVGALSRVAPADEKYFRANADAYLKTLDGKIAQWSAAMKPFAGAKVVTFHKSWTYFVGWLGLHVAGQVEPKPGIAPSPAHTAELISLVRQSGIKVIIVEPFYDLSAPDQIARSTGIKVIRLATSVGGVDGAKDYISLMDQNIATLTGGLR